MDKKYVVSLSVLILAGSALLAEPALAGPGSTLLPAAFESFWVKLALSGMVAVCLSLAFMTVLQHKKSEQRARQDLRYMAAFFGKFEWLRLQDRALDCFQRFHSGREGEDLSRGAGWMTSSYRQSRQMASLDKQQETGLVHVCNIREIKAIRPLFFEHRNACGEHEQSLVVISITANMQDYLLQRDTGKVARGNQRFREVESVWSFTMEGGEWKVSGIDDHRASLAYAKRMKGLPAIERTLLQPQ